MENAIEGLKVPSKVDCAIGKVGDKQRIIVDVKAGFD